MSQSVAFIVEEEEREETLEHRITYRCERQGRGGYKKKLSLRTHSWAAMGGGGGVVVQRDRMEKDPPSSTFYKTALPSSKQNVAITADVTANHITHNSPRALAGLTEKVLTS